MHFDLALGLFKPKEEQGSRPHLEHSGDRKANVAGGSIMDEKGRSSK